MGGGGCGGVVLRGPASAAASNSKPPVLTLAASMRPAARPPTSEPLPPSGISTASVMDAVQKRMAEVHKATAPVPVDGHPSWVQCTSPEGYPFFFNTDTGGWVWDGRERETLCVCMYVFVSLNILVLHRRVVLGASRQDAGRS